MTVPPPPHDPAAPFYDLPTLRALRATFAALDPAAPPQARILTTPAPQPSSAEAARGDTSGQPSASDSDDIAANPETELSAPPASHSNAVSSGAEEEQAVSNAAALPQAPPLAPLPSPGLMTERTETRHPSAPTPHPHPTSQPPPSSSSPQLAPPSQSPPLAPPSFSPLAPLRSAPAPLRSAADGGARGASPRRPTPSSLIPHPSSLVPPLPLAILVGSFDPLTNAHLALAHAALTVGGCTTVYLALSKHTVNKETRDRPTDADRALLLRLVAARTPGLGVLAFNCGLYVDQAIAARAAFPHTPDLRFIVGFDKARQIFDPRYYPDRDIALRALFAHVSLLVAPRASDSHDAPIDSHESANPTTPMAPHDPRPRHAPIPPHQSDHPTTHADPHVPDGPDALDALLDRPENHPFRDHVHPLPLDPAYATDSSTIVRAAARDGHPLAALNALVPPETLTFIAALLPYAPPTPTDHYTRREALLTSLTATPDPSPHPNLRTLLHS